MSLSGSFFNAINRTNILRNMILKRLFLILAPTPTNLRKTLTFIMAQLSRQKFDVFIMN